MALLRRIVLVRHGETDGESSVRFHGSSDVDLSEEGRAQALRVAAALRKERFDLVVASPLRRSWRSAWIVGRGAPIRLEGDFREIHFGRWEGLNREEIEARDPILHRDWQSGADGFEYPEGEPRAAFRERVTRGLARLLATDAGSALAVLHKGVMRVIVEELTGKAPAPEELELGCAIALTRNDDDSWFRGRHSSKPPALS